MTNARKNINLWLSIGGTVLVTAVYIYLYQTSSSSPAWWKDAYLNFVFPVVAILGASLATYIWRQFDPADRPRAVWRNFALGLWMWAVAEVIWAVYFQIQGDVPAASLVDVPWVIGYFFFGAALLYQYRLVFRSTPNQKRRFIATAIVTIVILSVAGAGVLRRIIGTEEGPLATLLNIFYPLGDLALAGVALVLARAFGGGRWARPWIALLVFAVADALYTALLLSGLYETSAEQGSTLSMIADTAYLDAYIALALACHAQLLLLRRGPRQPPT